MTCRVSTLQNKLYATAVTSCHQSRNGDCNDSPATNDANNSNCDLHCDNC